MIRIQNYAYIEDYNKARTKKSPDKTMQKTIVQKLE